MRMQHQRLDEGQIRAIYRFMYRHVGNREDAERLTEQTCLQAARAARRPPEGQSLQKILWQTARTVVAEHLRWFYGALATTAADTSSDEQDDPPARVRCILAHLPQRERDFLARRFLDNDSLADTAAALHMTPSDAQMLQWFALLGAARLTQEEERCSIPQSGLPHIPRPGLRTMPS